MFCMVFEIQKIAIEKTKSILLCACMSGSSTMLISEAANQRKTQNLLVFYVDITRTLSGQRS